MNTRNKALLTGTGLVAAFALFFAVNVASNQGLRDARLDLTQARLYTLSDGTRNVLKGLQEPVTLRFFFSDKLATQAPQIKQYGQRVRELLERYAALSGGKLRLEVIDPEPFSEAEDRAVAAGIQAVSLGQSGQNFYFGLVGTNSVDQQESIPFFQAEKEQFLEYDLTKLVYGLNNPKKPQIAVLGSLPLEYGPGGIMAAMRGQSQPYLVLGQIKQFFDVKMLEGAKAEDIDPAKIDTLLLAHPKDLSDELQYAVDQFVLKGGRLIVFADPYSETMAAMPNPMTGQPMPGGDSGSLLPKLFNAWGVEVEPKFVADLALAQRVQTGRSGAGAVADYIPWLALTQAQMNADDIVTSQITAINLASAGAIKKREGGTTSIQPLMQSSNNAMLMDVADLRGDPNPQVLAEKFKASGEVYTLAARISGPAKTAFPDGPPAPKADAEKKEGESKPTEAAPQVKESAKPINVVLVADADLLDDRFWVRTQQMFGQSLYVPIAANADFVVNAIDNLSGSGDLIGLRSRGKSQRPFDVIEGLRRNAEQQYQARERSLQKKLEETEKQIADLQSKAGSPAAGAAGANALVSAEQQAAIEGLRGEILNTRKELRNVQRELNRDIEQLQLGIKFINIGLVPLLAAVVAIGLSLAWRRRRVTRRVEG